MSAPDVRHIDARALPPGALDHRAPIWWGNTLLLLIESTMFALLVAVYLYLRQNAQLWPPPRTQHFPVLLDASPSLLFPTLNMAWLLLSCVPMYIADQAALVMDRRGVVRWTGIALLMGLVAIAIRVGDFRALHFRWDENAYASITWTLVGLHALHLLVVFVEGLLTWEWVVKEGLDIKAAIDVRCSAIYWFWVVAMWALVYAVVYLGPQLR